ncbi:DUF3375 domain-containing protein [Kocuria nitroreducens]|uniref:DUF3375 domain-containing protein n=1 Tax=Kocuria nitroreducens TaxID=3058914 RepID=UPI0036D9575A
MSTRRTATQLDRARAQDVAWRLLRADLAPVAVAVLGEHLTGNERVRPAHALYQLMEADFQDLRAAGFEIPREPQAYCSEWTRDGYLNRRPTAESREETFELTPGALDAIRFLQDRQDPRTTTTESRLTTIAQQVRALAQETNPDAAQRLAALRAERDRLDAQITRLDAGQDDTLDPDRALERLHELLALARELPHDFTRVRWELEHLHRELMNELLEQSGSRGDVLDDLFAGVDRLEASDAGRTFSAFFDLVLDLERSEEFDENIAQILSRPVFRELPRDRQRALSRLMTVLQERGHDVSDVMASLSRGLRRFVQSEQFQQARQLNAALQRASRTARDLVGTVPPYRKLDVGLALTSAELVQVSSWSLHNPADSLTPPVVDDDAALPDIDPAALRAMARATEIDFQELTAAVNEVLAERGHATIAEVLEHHSATQGLASVVGLLVLAQDHAAPLEGAPEPVAWTGENGTGRRATVPRHLFTREIV